MGQTPSSSLAIYSGLSRAEYFLGVVGNKRTLPTPLFGGGQGNKKNLWGAGVASQW